MTLPLVLLAHPSANVRSAAADAFASRVAAAPVAGRQGELARAASRARAMTTPNAKIAANGKPDASTTDRASARAVLATLRAVASGAAQPLGAPASLRALAPLAAPADGGGSGGGDSSSSSSAPFSFLRPGGSEPDPRARATSLVLLAEIWRHHRGAFPRLRAALERAGSSRQPEVVIGAAAACAAAARADPRRATELALPIRECLDASAPAPARALAMEAIASMCEADALDFYLAFGCPETRARRASLTAASSTSGGPVGAAQTARRTPTRDRTRRRRWSPPRGTSHARV